MQNLQNLQQARAAGVSPGRSNATLYTYMNLPGAGADYASVPDAANLDLTTEFEVIACAALASWTPGAANTIISKYDTNGNQRGYRLEVLGTGNLALGLSNLGTAVTTGNSGAATNFPAGSARWIRATWRASDGRVQFFTSTKAPTSLPSGGDWVQLGTDQTIAMAGIFDTTASFMIGRQQTAAIPLPMTGKVYRTILKSTIGGSTVLDFNPIGHVGETSFSDGTNTFTINGAAAIVQA